MMPNTGVGEGLGATAPGALDSLR